MAPDDHAGLHEQRPPPEPLLRMIQGLQTTAILQTGVELGVFDLVAAGTTSAKEIASTAGASERGTRILLDGLTALGLLAGDAKGYGLTPLSDAYLVSDRPGYLGGTTRLMASKWAWQGWASLEEAVRRGGTVLDEHAETPGNVFWETFAPSSVGVAQPKSEALAELLSPWAAKHPTLDVLDVACGSGLYSLTLAARQKHARVTLLDWANVLALTRENVERLGLANRTTVIEGDVFTVPLGGPYDLIVASHIFHHFSEQRCLELLQRLRSVLRPDGKLAIHEFTAESDQPADEPAPYLFSVLMLMWTREGAAYPVSTYRRLLEAAGFSAPEVQPSPDRATRFLIAGPSAAA